MKKAMVVLVLAAFTLPARAWDVATLMADLARRHEDRARFVEKKTIALLDRPVVSSGELRFVAPDHLEKRTLLPKPGLLVIDGDLLTIERGERKLSLRLSEQPGALALVDSLRGTLAGDLAALKRSYKLTLSGDPKHWTLDLLPDDQRIAKFVVRITFGGSHDRVEWIRYLQADGDSSVMTIEPERP
jgi:Outer membrane lipoprotein carrier protein LolA-like